MRGKGEGSIFKDSRGLWTGVIELPSPDGNRRRKVVRRKDKRELLAEMTRLKGDLAIRGDLPTKTQTVEQWFTHWLTIVAKEVRPNTYDGYMRTVRNHIIPAIGSVKLDKVTATTVRKVHDAILAKDLSTTTALLAHRVMSVSFKMAVREGRIGRNPAELTAPPRKARPNLEALDLEDAIKLLSYCTTDQRDGVRWATGLLTGARRGEVLGLEFDRVTDILDLSWQLIRIKKTDVDGRPHVPADYEYRHVRGGLYLTRPKSAKSWRIVPLVDPLKTILQEHIDAQEPNEYGLVFTRKGRPISPDHASAEWRKALAAAGVEKNARLHDGRHTTVDLLYAAAVPEDIIMEIVGHSTRSMTQSYKTVRNRERLMGALEQFNAQFATKPLREISG